MQKNLIQSPYLAKKKALEIQLLSSAKLVHTACVPRAPAAVLRAVGVVRGRHQTKTNRAMFYRTNCRVFIITVLNFIILIRGYLT